MNTHDHNGPCPDCGTGPGENHRDECDVERCPGCLGQLLTCDCRRPPRGSRIPWSGEWPGVAECRAWGWYARRVPGRGLVPCGPGEPGAEVDLRRFGREARWDWRKRSFVV